MSKKFMSVLGLLVVASMLLAACGATPTAQVTNRRPQRGLRRRAGEHVVGAYGSSRWRLGYAATSNAPGPSPYTPSSCVASS